jgi:chromosome segregation ATPase
MDNKIKLLVIGLGVLAAVSLLIAFQLNITNKKIELHKVAVEQELAKVTQENEKLAKDLSDALSRNRSIASDLKQTETKGKQLQEEIDKLKERLDLTTSERDGFIEKIQKLVDDKRKTQEELDKEKAKSKEAAKKEAEKKEKDKEESPTAEYTYAPSSSQEAFWADVLRQKADAELELENVKTQLKEITYKADELLRDRNAIEMELKNATQQKDDLERKASYNEKLSRALSEDLVREKNDKDALASQLDKLREDNTQMRTRIKELESTKTTLYKKIDALEQERGALKGKLIETEGVVSERVDEIVKIQKDLETFQTKEMPSVVPGSRTVELSPIVVIGKQDAVKSTLTGRVLSVNKDNEFVVIDLSENSGVKINDKFNVYRNNKFIATIEVIQMRKDISAADILESAVGEDIKTGDIVKSIR